MDSYSSASWICELGMEDPDFAHHFEMNSQMDHCALDELANALGVGDYNQPPFSSESFSSHTYSNIDQLKDADLDVEPDPTGQPTEFFKTGQWADSRSVEQVPAVVPEAFDSTPTFISLTENTFQGHKYQRVGELTLPVTKSVSPTNDAEKSRGMDRTLVAPQDHVIAERKRREKLSQKFIALSAIVPGLKKMDKASILSDAIKYLKQLQERVKTLEDHTSKRTVESVVLVKQSRVSVDESMSSGSRVSDGQQQPGNSLPEIEFKISDKTILLRIQCERRKGMLGRVISEVERHNLTIASTNVVSFGWPVVDITIVALIEEEFPMTIKNLVRNLSKALKQFM